MAEVRIEDLSVIYKAKKKKGETIPNVIAVDKVNALFEKGSFNVIIGYSGCGKTSLLKAIADILPYDGYVFLDNTELTNLPLIDRNISFVSQNYVLYPNLTIFDNIAMPLKVSGADRLEIIERVKDIAEKMDLIPCLTRKPKHISGGQQQRAALARAMVKHPRVCLFDEPLSNVDPTLRFDLRNLIRKTCKEYRCTVIYVTHDFFEAMALADYIFVMNEGKLIECGKPMEIYNSTNEIVLRLKEASEKYGL